MAVPCRLVLAVKQVLRIGRGQQKCHLADLLSFMPKLLLSLSLVQSRHLEKYCHHLSQGQTKEKGVEERMYVSLKINEQGVPIWHTQVQLNGRQYIYSHRVLLCVQLHALSDRFAIEIHSTLGYNGLRK